jgi:YidC/Oxa1 family membrane protein insertase
LEFIWNSLWHLLLNILVAINSVINIPGVSIIVFTIFIRTLTIPLTMKSLKSSRNMQAIQPLMKEIQKKHKDDRQKQQEETMKLYREYGINPAAGCFPLLVQIPIFFGLFAALQFTLQPSSDPAHLAALQAILWNPDWATAGYADFGTASFLWVPSLAAADPYFIWPILSGIFQFFQSRMSLPKRDPNTPQDPQQRMMSGMMQFMPVYITLISLGFPAGNVIYWAFSSLFGAVQQYFITGWGSLPDFPGFGWLPHKPPPAPKPLPTPVPGEARRAGMFARMMDRALEAQEARKTEDAAKLAQSGAGTGATGAGEPTRPVTTSARAANQRGNSSSGASTTRVRSKASEPNIRIVQSTGTGTPTVKYASDARPKSSNGAATTALPPKK